ncbi:MAG: hypothetical protein II189_05940, partial [Lachnospiraceae bacterium]|nr:hypothetical protein [Lachnospiraceae bacterium]
PQRTDEEKRLLLRPLYQAVRGTALGIAYLNMKRPQIPGPEDLRRGSSGLFPRRFLLEKCHAETMKKRAGKGRFISLRAADIVKCMLKE